MNFLKILFLLSLSNVLFAEKVEIVSDSMQAIDTEKKVLFEGHVKLKQDENYIHSHKVIVYFNENNETNQYEAVGNVNFKFKQKKSHYKGHANRVIYYPLTSKYILMGKASIDDLINNRHIDGEKIVLDMKSGNASVRGNRKKPVKFIFDMEKK